jgi:sterol desaturase/sphingolipid hydroxylase (fatty acid hydroxylase superfamily)
MRLMWAAHSVHHSQNSFNLSAAVRLPWTGAVFAVTLNVLPLVSLGFNPLAVLAFFSLNLLYQFMLHTRFIKSFGRVGWILNAPNHHLVHHASNLSCLDKNYGGILIIFDRLFGTFAKAPETEQIRFGLVDPMHSNNPLVIQFREWWRLGNDLLHAKSLGSALLILFRPPTHRPA